VVGGAGSARANSFTEDRGRRDQRRLSLLISSPWLQTILLLPAFRTSPQRVPLPAPQRVGQREVVEGIAAVVPDMFAPGLRDRVGDLGEIRVSQIR